MKHKKIQTVRILSSRESQILKNQSDEVNELNFLE